MSKPDFSKTFLVVAAGAIALTPISADSKPRMIRVNGDGTTAETTQKKGGSQDTATPETTTDSTSEPSKVTDATGVTSSTSTVQSDYLSTLSPSYTPSLISWAGRDFRVNAGSTWNLGKDHSVRVSQSRSRIRFEIRNVENDNSSSDPASKRRAEISGKLPNDSTRLPNGRELWGAFSTRHQSWADPAGMSKLWGGVYGQIHMGPFGGSPAVAFRRRKDGAFHVTTRGEFDTAGTIRYIGNVPFDQVHDIVYNVVLHERAGSLKVWVNGSKVVDVANVSIGSSKAGHFWTFGTYFAGGVTSPVVAEYASHVYPGTSSLSTRIKSPPMWPS